MEGPPTEAETKGRDERTPFPCELEAEQYVESGGQGEACLFDREGVLLREVTPQRGVPTLRQGPNAITLSAGNGEGLCYRGEVAVIRFGED
jgi:hypothetical protein